MFTAIYYQMQNILESSIDQQILAPVFCYQCDHFVRDPTITSSIGVPKVIVVLSASSARDSSGRKDLQKELDLKYVELGELDEEVAYRCDACRGEVYFDTVVCGDSIIF